MNDDLCVYVGNGQMQMYASNEQKYEGRLESLEAIVLELKRCIATLAENQIVGREKIENQLSICEMELICLKKAQAKKRRKGLITF